MASWIERSRSGVADTEHRPSSSKAYYLDRTNFLGSVFVVGRL